MTYSAPQKEFFGLVWPLRVKYEQLNYLNLITDPNTRTRHIILLCPHDPYHALILPIGCEMSQYLDNLNKQFFQVRPTRIWTEAVKILFQYFRGVVPQAVIDKIDKIKEPSKHYRYRLGNVLAGIRDARALLLENIKANPKNKPFNVDQFIQKSVDDGAHPKYIQLCLERLNANWPKIFNPWGYIETICKVEEGNFNAADAQLLHQHMKHMDASSLQGLLSNIGH